MHPLSIDFAPMSARSAAPHGRARWFAGGVGALLVVLSSAAWLATAPVEASHMAAPTTRYLPGADEAQAVDAAVRELNLPWLAAIDALAAAFGPAQDAVLQRMEADVPRGVIRIAGEAGTATVVQALPARLRTAGLFDGATLIRQETQGDSSSRPVLFVIELTLKEGA